MRKSFDQQKLMLDFEECLDESKTKPNKTINTYVVLEPVEHQGVTRVRVTARDEEMNLIWGVMVSEGLLPTSSPTPVSFYSSLRRLIRDNLANTKPKYEISPDPYEAIEYCENSIKELLKEASKKTVQVKSKKETTDARANDVANILLDALQQLSYSLEKAGIKVSSSTGKE